MLSVSPEILILISNAPAACEWTCPVCWKITWNPYSSLCAADREPNDYQCLHDAPVLKYGINGSVTRVWKSHLWLCFQIGQIVVTQNETHPSISLSGRQTRTMPRTVQSLSLFFFCSSNDHNKWQHYHSYRSFGLLCLGRCSRQAYDFLLGQDEHLSISIESMLIQMCLHDDFTT